MILLLGQGTCIHYDVLRHMNGDEFSQLCLCRATGRKEQERNLLIYPGKR